MSKACGWVPLDKGLIKSLPKDRPYTHLEAMFSYTVDQECENQWTIKGYSKLWSWSRCKVRKFIEDIKTQEGHAVDTLKTGKRHPIHYIDKGLWESKDTEKTPERHGVDTPPTPTNNPLILNPKEKKKDTRFRAAEFLLSAGADKNLVDDWLKVRKTRRLANTETAFKAILEEVVTSGMCINEILTICCQRSWGSFKAEWLKKKNKSAQAHQPRLTGTQAYMVELGNMLEQLEERKNGANLAAGSGITDAACFPLPGDQTYGGDT